MIANDQITALAREYADMLKHLFPDMPEHTYRDKMSQAKNVINIIMRRYFLVEKEAVRKEYQETCERETYATEHKNELYAELFKMRRLTLEFLFPDLGKEAE